MARLLLSLLIIISSPFLANAQFSKGSVLLGGQLSYGYNSYNQVTTSFPSTNDQKTNNGNFTISIGKALNDNRIVGLNLSYLPSSSNNYQTLGIGPLKYQNNGYAAGFFTGNTKTWEKNFIFSGRWGLHITGPMNQEKIVRGKKY